MAISDKSPSDLDGSQTLQHSFNDVDDSFTTSGFVTAQVGNQIVFSSVNATTVNVAYSEAYGANPLYTLQLVYTDSTQATLVSATRIA